jgi:hypothetical protein
VTVIGFVSGSVTLTLSVGEVDCPVAAFAGAFKVGAFGLAAAIGAGWTNPTDDANRDATVTIGRTRADTGRRLEPVVKRARLDDNPSINKPPRQRSTGRPREDIAYRMGDRRAVHPE